MFSAPLLRLAAPSVMPAMQRLAQAAALIFVSQSHPIHGPAALLRQALEGR
jgi:hypothetical protein